MNVAILDDSLEELEIAYQFVKSYYSIHNIVGEIKTYTDYQSILHVRNIDCYILDVFLKNANGVSLAALLLKLNPLAKIIFMSSSSEYSPPAHELRPVGFIIKPVTKMKLYDQLDHVRRSYEYCFVIDKSNNGIRRKIYTSDILYIKPYDYKKQTILYSASQGELIIELSMNDWKAQLNPDFFFNVYKSVIVNLQTISKIEGQTITFKNGASINGKKEKVKLLCEKYFEYLDNSICF